MKDVSIQGIILIFLSLLFYTHFFQFFLWQETIGPKIIPFFYYGCLICSIILILCNKNKIIDTNENTIPWLLLLPICSGIYKIIVTGQSLETERISLLTFFSVSQYYLMRAIKVKEKDIIIAVTCFGIITLCIQIFQQITDIPLFGIINNDEQNTFSQRNGIFRFYIGCMLVSIFCTCYWLDNVFKKTNGINILLLICFFISIYLYMVRQNMIGTIVGISCSIFTIDNKKLKRFAFAIVFIFICLLIIYYDVLFSELVDSYKSDTNTTDIRWKCIMFVLQRIFDDPIRMLIGHGHDIIEQTWTNKGYYLSDIGMIGQTYYYGILWLYIYVRTLYKYMILMRKKIPFYILTYMVITFITAIFSGPIYDNSTMFLWICTLYICHLYVDNIESRFY